MWEELGRTLLDFFEGIRDRAAGDGTEQAKNRAESVKESAVESVRNFSCTQVLRVRGLQDVSVSRARRTRVY